MEKLMIRNIYLLIFNSRKDWYLELLTAYVWSHKLHLMFQTFKIHKYLVLFMKTIIKYSC